MLLYVNGKVIEIRPQEILSIPNELHSRFLEEQIKEAPVVQDSPVEVVKEVKWRKKTNE